MYVFRLKNFLTHRLIAFNHSKILNIDMFLFRYILILILKVQTKVILVRTKEKGKKEGKYIAINHLITH